MYSFRDRITGLYNSFNTLYETFDALLPGRHWSIILYLFDERVYNNMWNTLAEVRRSYRVAIIRDYPHEDIILDTIVWRESDV